MKVRLQNPWFSPGESDTRPDGRTYSGAFYDKGEHVMPDELRSKLPKSAIILDEVAKPEPLTPAEIEKTFRDFDDERPNAVATEEVLLTSQKKRTKK